MRVGFLGAGVMARGMVKNLLSHGHEVRVYNRTPERVARLVALGAMAAASPADAARGADVVASCVTDGAAVREVWLGSGGALAATAPGALAIDLSTIAPADAQALARACREAGVAFVDAPITGGEAGADAGTLTIFVGGEADDVATAQPFFGAIGQVVHHVGAVGSGQAVKLVQNLVGGLNLLAAIEGGALAQAYGLEPTAVLAMLEKTTAQSRSAEILLDRLRTGNVQPGFSLHNRLKDFRLALDMAHAAACPVPLAAAGAQACVRAVAQGLGDLDQTTVWQTAAGTRAAARG